MMRKINTFIINNWRFIPLSVTVALFFLVYAFGAYNYPGMRDPQVFFNLFRTSPFLLISAIGMTFVILTGGIDLSVSGVVALTTVVAAALLREGWNAWVVMLLLLLMGMTLGAIMGVFIAYLKVQPFIATLAGMWFARGLCFFISDDAIAINNWIYRLIGQTKILIPGLSDPATQEGVFISILVVLEAVFLAVAMYIAHYTRFGRTVYAIGGEEGRNEQSARLMGLPVERTKVLVYTLSGFCSALAGISLSIYVSSGHGLYAQGFELTVIAAVVIGGTMLTGGTGYVFGTLFGVLILGLIQTLIQFNGRLSSWWTSIVIGILMLIFIGVQSLLAAQKRRQVASKKTMDAETEEAVPEPKAAPNMFRMAMYGVGMLAIIIFGVLVFNRAQSAPGEVEGSPLPPSEEARCQLKDFRQDLAAEWVNDGAVLTYERNGGPDCIDEVYAIYPDGRIVGDNGIGTIEETIPSTEVGALVSEISGRGWFTDEMYDTWHTPCRQCYSYYITVAYEGQEKTVQAVDGGTDAPADYWQVVSLINRSIPKFDAP